MNGHYKGKKKKGKQYPNPKAFVVLAMICILLKSLSSTCLLLLSLHSFEFQS